MLGRRQSGTSDPAQAHPSAETLPPPLKRALTWKPAMGGRSSSRPCGKTQRVCVYQTGTLESVSTNITASQPPTHPRQCRTLPLQPPIHPPNTSTHREAGALVGGLHVDVGVLEQALAEQRGAAHCSQGERVWRIGRLLESGAPARATRPPSPPPAPSGIPAAQLELPVNMCLLNTLARRQQDWQWAAAGSPMS